MKQKVGQRLEYATEGEGTVCIKHAKLPQHAATEAEHRRKLEEVRNFYTHLQCKDANDEQQQQQQQEEEGITWLELFVLYHRHGGNLNDDKDVLGNNNTLQKDVAAFKKLSRNVFNLTCPLEHEWIMKPSNAR